MGGRSGGSGKSSGGVVALIKRAGGVLGGEFLNEGFKSFAWTDKAFAGASARQATAIASGRADVREAYSSSIKRLPAIQVAVDTLRNGKTVVSLTDGRHRAISAARAGATHIRAEVTRNVQTTSGWQSSSPVTRIVSLGKPQGRTLKAAKKEGKL